MIILIAGASHTGKTLLAQRLLEKYHIPYLSIDHLKMGLIRSGNTDLTPEDDDKLTAYLWPILKEMIKTAIENAQNLIVEGCYIPFDWKKDFAPSYLEQICAYFLVMTEDYIKIHYGDIKAHASAVENRGDDGWFTMEKALEENAEVLELCKKHGCHCILIDRDYCPAAAVEQDMEKKSPLRGKRSF